MTRIIRCCCVLVACVIASACTDNQSEGVAAPSDDVRSVVAPPEAAVAAELTEWTRSLDGLSESPLCALDAVNGQHASEGAFAIGTGQPATFEGWVSMTNLQSPPAMSIIFDGLSDFQVTGVTGITRSDVAEAHSSDALASAGFKIELPQMDLPAGEYSIVIEHDEAGSSVICNTGLKTVVE